MPVAERKRMRGITTTLKSVRSNFLATLGKQLQEFVNISKIHDLTHRVTAGSERRAPQRISQSMLVDALFQPRCFSEFSRIILYRYAVTLFVGYLYVATVLLRRLRRWITPKRAH